MFGEEYGRVKRVRAQVKTESLVSASANPTYADRLKHPIASDVHSQPPHASILPPQRYSAFAREETSQMI